VAAVGSIFLGGEGAAEDDGRAEEAKVRFRNVDAVDLLRNDAGEVEARTTEIVGSDILKDAGLGSPYVVVIGELMGPLPWGKVFMNCTMRSGSG
jgi:hypothetical protein